MQVEKGNGCASVMLVAANAVLATARTRRKEELSEIRRDEILAAATRVFGRKGFEATRAEDIADAAGIAKGTLYLYFKSKEAIYTAAVSQACRDLQAELQLHTAQASGFHNKLLTALEVRMQFWSGHQSLYGLLLTVGREPKHRQQTEKFLHRAQRDYLTLLQDAVAAKEFAYDDPEELAWAILDLVRGASQRRIDKLSRCTPREDAERITAFVLAQDARRKTPQKQTRRRETLRRAAATA